MANPFSGLENIGQSYLAGVQLAQQRQLREEAIAQRQEEARIRERYYQDIIGERQAQREALRQQRMDQFASLFGRHLKLTPEGEVDIPGSALARDRAIQEEQLAAAEGELGALYGTQAPLSPEIIASPAYQTGKMRGTAKRLAQEKDLTAAMIRRGFIPVDQEQDRELPDEVRSQIEDISVPDVFSGQAPMALPAQGVPRVRFRGREFIPPAPPAKKPEKPVKAGTLKLVTPEGEMEVYLTPEMVAERMAKKDTEPTISDDIEAARKQLQSLQDKGIEDFNLTRDREGNIKVVEDTAFSMGRSADEIMADLNLEAKKRAERRGDRTIPGGIPQGTNRVIPISAIPGLPPLRGR